MTPFQQQELARQLQAQGYSEQQINKYLEYKQQQEQPAQKKAGNNFLKTLAKDAMKTLIVKPAARVGQAAAYGLGALTKDEHLKQAAFEDTNINLGFLGSYNIEGQKAGIAGVKQVAGDAAKSASYIYTPGAATGAVRTATQAAGKGFLQGAKAGAVTGGLYSGGEALQQDKSLADTAKDTLKGAATGALVGGAMSGAVGGVSKLSSLQAPTKAGTSKAVQHLEKRYDEIFTGTKSGKKAFDKSTARGKTPSKFLAEHGYVVDVKGGKIDASATIEKINKNTEPLEEVLDDILKTKDQIAGDANRVSLDILGRKAKAAINTEQNKASGYLGQQSKEIDRLIGELKTAYGDTVSLSQLNAIKRGQWQQAKVFDATRPNYSKDIHYTLGKQAKETIEELVPEADVKQLNSYLGDHWDAITNLQKVDGNAVKGGRLGNYSARIVGAVIGAQGGPVGSIAGALGGDIVANIMQNHYLASPIKRMMLQKVLAESAESSPVRKAAEEALRKLKAGQSLMRLPAPKPGSPTQSINVPIKMPSKVVPPDQPFKGKGALSR